MRLRQLDAQFISGWHPGGYTRQATVEGAQGILFQCPLCAQGKEYGEEDDPVIGHRGFYRGAHYVLCWFTNPRNAPRVPDDADPKPGRWTFEGDTVDTITFVGPAAASVLLTPPGCGWHGFVKNGDAS